MKSYWTQWVARQHGGDLSNMIISYRPKLIQLKLLLYTNLSLLRTLIIGPPLLVHNIFIPLLLPPVHSFCVKLIYFLFKFILASCLIPTHFLFLVKTWLLLSSSLTSFPLLHFPFPSSSSLFFAAPLRNLQTRREKETSLCVFPH